MLDLKNNFYCTKLEFGDSEVIANGIKMLKTLLGFELLQQLNSLTEKEIIDLQEGRTITQSVKSVNFHFALELSVHLDEDVISEVFKAVGKSKRYRIKTYYYHIIDHREHFLDIELAPDEDFIDFEKEDEVEEIIIEAVAEQPLKAMAAGAGRRF